MTIPEQKLCFIQEFVANSKGKSFLVLFSDRASFDDFGFQINRVSNRIKARRVCISTDLLGIRVDNIFLWADAETYLYEARFRISNSFSGFLYDLENEEYILDTAAKNA